MLDSVGTRRSEVPQGWQQLSVVVRNRAGNIVTSASGNSITLVATGSPTGAGTANLLNGEVLPLLSNNVAENVTLTLVDNSNSGFSNVDSHP